jgi:hypothetical protein
MEPPGVDATMEELEAYKAWLQAQDAEGNIVLSDERRIHKMCCPRSIRRSPAGPQRLNIAHCCTWLGDICGSAFSSLTSFT